MSQTVVEKVELTVDEFNELKKKAFAQRIKQAERCGPSYSSPESAPLVWYDQVFEREFSPTGSVTCSNALRVGGTQNSLDIILVASHANTANVVAAASSTITVTIYQGDSRDGTFTEIGPTICVKAPTEGISAEPCHLLARFAVGNFYKPWLKVKLDFSGTISGGKLDCALGYVPR